MTQRPGIGPFKPSGAMFCALVYVVITCAMGHRVLDSLGSAIASDAGDPILNAAILEWNARHVPWTDAWFQFPIFHPTRNALTFSEHLLGVSVVSGPVSWLTANPVAAYNVALLLSYPLSGLAMYALVWRLTRSSPAAFLAGLAFAFAPYRASQLPHIQMLTVFWAPLALLGLHAFLDGSVRLPPPRAERASASLAGAFGEGGKPDSTNDDAENGRSVPLQADRQGRWPWPWLALFAVCWSLQGAANGYLLVYFSALVALWVLWFLVARRRWREVLLVVAAGAAAILPLVPILSRYIAARGELGLTRNLGEIASFGADITAPLCASDRLAFWSWLRVGCSQEGELFSGVTLVALCLAGVFWNRRHESQRRGDAEAPPATSTPRLSGSAVRRGIGRAAVAVAIVFFAIAASVVAFGPWRVELGWLRASASSVDKPASTALALLLIAFVLSDRFRAAVARGSTAAFYSGAALVCWVLSWGPFPRLLGLDALYQAPYAWLLQVPGVDGLRVPARFWMMTVLCLSVLAGLGAAGLLRGRTRRVSAAIVGLATAGLLVDGWVTIPAAALPPPVASADALRGAPVLVLPAGQLEQDVAAVYHAVTGGWQAINGFSGYEPGYYEALRTLSDAGDPGLVDAFLRLGDVIVVEDGAVRRLPARPARAASPPPGLRLEARGRDASCSPQGLALATDGNPETSWVCGVQDADQHVTFDLGRIAQAGAIVHVLGTRGADFPRHLIVDTSLDAAAWEPAWEGSPAAAVLMAGMDAPRLTRVIIPFTPRAARYVRLRQTGRHERNYWSIAELEVWSGK